MINGRILIWMHLRMDQETMNFKISQYIIEFSFPIVKIVYSLLQCIFACSYSYIYTHYHMMYILYICSLSTLDYWKLWFVWLSDVWCSLKKNVMHHYLASAMRNNFFFEKFKCATISKICITNQMFHFSKRCSLYQWESVTRVKKKGYKR